MEDNDYIRVFQLLQSIKYECSRKGNYMAMEDVDELTSLLRNKFVLWKKSNIKYNYILDTEHEIFPYGKMLTCYFKITAKMALDDKLMANKNFESEILPELKKGLSQKIEYGMRYDGEESQNNEWQ